MNPTPDASPPPPPEGRLATLWELARLFLWLGATAFGGPAAHVALMEENVVRRRGWLTHEEFLDLLGATNLIPGPNSTEMAIHVGLRRAGWAGLLVAGVGFVAPAAVIVTALAWVYVRYGTRPAASGLLYGVKPVIIAVIGQALWRLGRVALGTRRSAALAVLAVTLLLLGVDELAVLFGTGLGAAAVAGLGRRRGRIAGAVFVPVAVTPLAAGVGVTPAAIAPFGLWPLFLFFLKVGSVLFGSGYVLLAFLRTDLVVRLGWLTEGQLLDAVAVGQITPGPLFTTATFIGYVLAGLPGAALATLGIFLPSFVFVAASGPLVPRLRKSAAAGAFLDGVNAASLALMGVVTWRLGLAAVVDLPAAALAAAAAAVLARHPHGSVWLMLAGAAIGLSLRG